jgi:hypothetical protein
MYELASPLLYYIVVIMSIFRSVSSQILGLKQTEEKNVF